MRAYADTNFFTRLYIETVWTKQAMGVLEEMISARCRLPVLWLHRVEIRNAFELYVFAGRHGSGPRVSHEAAAAAQARFRADCRGRFGPFKEASIPVETWEATAEEISLRHSARYGFRTYDVLHVAAARELGATTFFSYDARCNKLAGFEGLETPLL